MDLNIYLQLKQKGKKEKEEKKRDSLFPVGDLNHVKLKIVLKRQEISESRLA